MKWLSNQGYLLIVITAIAWSGNTIIGRGVVDIIPPIGLSFWRWVAVFPIFLVIAWPHLRKDLPPEYLDIQHVNLPGPNHDHGHQLFSDQHIPTCNHCLIFSHYISRKNYVHDGSWARARIFGHRSNHRPGRSECPPNAAIEYW